MSDPVQAEVLMRLMLAALLAVGASLATIAKWMS